MSCHKEKMLAALLFLCLTLVVTAVPLKQGENGTVTVQTEDGLLRGQVVTSIWNRTYFSFQNVPFAQPPVGELRFKSPKPVKPWTGVRDATEPGPYCFQNMRNITAKTSEDCLYLNVYVPQVEASDSPTKGLTVMVWIHGGGFVVGSGVEDRPDNLLNHSIILVTINYRLGSLGFLSMEHPDVTSNAALKDQVAALRWVKRNIAHFGGNPNDVMISGESAGGISVDLLQLSPMTTGLFHYAISLSGSAMVVNFKPDYNATGEAFRLGAALGYNGTDADDLLKVLRSVTAEDILKGHNIIAAEEGVAAGELSSFPVVDTTIQEGSEVFLTDIPEKLLRAGKAHPIPYITGFNSEEAKAYAAALSQAELDSYNTNPELCVPKSLNLRGGSVESIQLGKKIRSFYFGNKNVSYDTLPQLTDLMSDNFMIYSVYRSAKLHVEYGSSPLYKYMYTYEGTLDKNSGNTTVKGPAHGDNGNYVFPNVVPYNPSSSDLKVIRHFTGMFFDFAQSGDPSLHESVKWPPATKTNHTYLQIDVELSLHQDALKKRMAFWDSVYDTYKK